MEIHWKQAVDAATVMVSQLSWLTPAAEHLWPKKWWPPFWVQKMVQNPRDHLRISSISCNYESYDILWLYLMAISMYFPFSDPNKIEVYSDALRSSRPAERAFDLFRTLRWSSGGFGGGQGTTSFGNRKQRQNRWYRLISVDISYGMCHISRSFLLNVIVY